MYHWPNCLFENVMEKFQVTFCQLPIHYVIFPHCLQLGTSCSSLCRLLLQNNSASSAVHISIVWMRLPVIHELGVRYKLCSTYKVLKWKRRYLYFVLEIQHLKPWSKVALSKAQYEQEGNSSKYCNLFRLRLRQRYEQQEPRVSDTLQVKGYW